MRKSFISRKKEGHPHEGQVEKHSWQRGNRILRRRNGIVISWGQETQPVSETARGRGGQHPAGEKRGEDDAREVGRTQGGAVCALEALMRLTTSDDHG